MADTTNVRIFGSKEVQPVNKIIKVSRFQREEDKDDGYESFASVLEKEMARKKTEGKKEVTVEELRFMEGLNQYDARANAFIYRLSSTADYRA